MLICAEFLFVTTSVDGKRLAGPQGLDLALAGAVLGELAAYQRVAVEGGRLVTLDARPGGDPLLDHALGVLAQKAGKKPERALPALAKGMTGRTYQRLMAEGAVRREEGGFLRPERHPVVDPAARQALIDAGGRVLAGIARPDLHTGTLIALLAAVGAVPKVYDAKQFGVSGHELKKRAKAVAEQDWATGAAAAAIRSAQAATTAAMVAVSVATSAAVVTG